MRLQKPVIPNGVRELAFEAINIHLSWRDLPPLERSLTSFGMTRCSSIGSLVYADCVLDRVGDAVGLLVDLVQLTAFDQ